MACELLLLRYYERHHFSIFLTAMIIIQYIICIKEGAFGENTQRSRPQDYCIYQCIQTNIICIHYETIRCVYIQVSTQISVIGIP